MFKKISFAVFFSFFAVVGIAAAGGSKVTVCHNTSSDNNPIVYISVSENSLEAHLAHGDTLMSPEGSCSSGEPLPV